LQWMPTITHMQHSWPPLLDWRSLLVPAFPPLPPPRWHATSSILLKLAVEVYGSKNSVISWSPETIWSHHICVQDCFRCDILGQITIPKYYGCGQASPFILCIIKIIYFWCKDIFCPPPKYIWRKTSDHTCAVVGN
jgi:hypothetical protein